LSIINEYNNNKYVRSNIDTEEISPSAGIKLLKIFKDYPQQKFFFDKLIFDEKLMIYKKIYEKGKITQIIDLNKPNNVNNKERGEITQMVNLN
jgi:hypothetical protein